MTASCEPNDDSKNIITMVKMMLEMKSYKRRQRERTNQIGGDRDVQRFDNKWLLSVNEDGRGIM
jgi:hypothetical protein